MANNAELLLLVDDDALTLKSLSLLLEKSGYQVVTENSALIAQKTIQERGFENFSCILTDYRMPGMTGLQFTDWVRGEDPTLCAILLTAEGDKSIIADALRGGLSDFIEKPYRFAQVKESVAKAIERTRKRREVASKVSELHDIGELHGRLNFSEQMIIPATRDGDLTAYIVTRMHPIKETGGDFINFYTMPDGRFCLLLGDVSGHDLKAGFISAYFQGMVRGMLNMNASIKEVCEHFNLHLIRDWNRVSAAGKKAVLKTSLACCFMVFDFKHNKLTIFNHGTPSPIHCSSLKNIEKIGASGPPLGWFEDLEITSQEIALEEDGICAVWTDGLEDFADALGISAVTLASQLGIEADMAVRESILKTRKDDILLANVRWKPFGKQFSKRVIFYQKYAGGTEVEIDRYERLWQSSLRWIIDEITEERLGEISLCIRESLLNALVHGTKGDAYKNAYLSISFDSAERSLEVTVTDEGSGYEMLSEDREDKPNDFGHISYGLRIITAYARILEHRKQGRQTYMVFDLVLQNLSNTLP